MRIITQELWTKVQAKHGHYLIILDLSKSKEYTAIIKFIKPKTPIILSAVTKISSCRVYAISGRGIVQQGSYFGSIFFLFTLRVARAYTHGSQEKFLPNRF